MRTGCRSATVNQEVRHLFTRMFKQMIDKPPNESYQ